MTTVQVAFRVGRGRESRIELRGGETPTQIPRGRIPHVTRLMALAIRFDQLIRERGAADVVKTERPKNHGMVSS